MSKNALPVAAVQVLPVVAALVKEILDFIKDAIEAGKMDVEELRKKPLEYFVTFARDALDAQGEAEKHLP